MSWIRDMSPVDPGQNGSGPGFTRYTRTEFDALERQHNILVFVGNGFDIQALHDLGSSTDSRYESFYYYLKMERRADGNTLAEHMESQLQLHRHDGEHRNWSNIEAAVSASLTKDSANADRIYSDLRSLQSEFAQFLQYLTPPSVLNRLSELSQDNHAADRSLSEFLADITDRTDFTSMDFPRSIDHHHLFNYQFMNFNYTTLLDDYIYLDQLQFDPLKHRTIDTNFNFKHDPNCHLTPGRAPDAGYSGYVISDVVHPHGTLNTPRSLLFGIDAPDNYKTRRAPTQRLAKPYWSQAHSLYQGHFVQADLFIIFGCSLGKSDGWWWRGIVRGLQTKKEQHYPEGSTAGKAVEERAELIIYRRQDEDLHTVDSVKDDFLSAADVPSDAPDRQELLARIHVVVYDDTTTRSFLNTRFPQ